MSAKPEHLLILKGAQGAHSARRWAHVGLRFGANSRPEGHDDFVVQRGRGGAEAVPPPTGDVTGPKLRARVAVPHALGEAGRSGEAARLG